MEWAYGFGMVLGLFWVLIVALSFALDFDNKKKEKRHDGDRW